jgi:Mn-dependent DtxR family transcriptional regulator
MKIIPYLLVGNHPKTAKLKERIIQIIKILKENGGKIEAEELEKELGISRTEDPSLFYKPLASLRKWDLVQSHRKVEITDAGKKKFRTTYELTPEFFYKYIEKTLIELARKEIEMV